MKKIDRDKVYNKYDCKCGYCGKDIQFKEMQVDHIVPQREFLFHIKNQFRIPEFLKHLTELDVNHFDNLMPTCRVCNNWKNSHSLEQFRIEISEQVKRLNSYSSNYRMAKRYSLIAETVRPILFHFEATKQEDTNG